MYRVWESISYHRILPSGKHCRRQAYYILFSPTRLLEPDRYQEPFATPVGAETTVSKRLWKNYLTHLSLKLDSRPWGEWGSDVSCDLPAHSALVYLSPTDRPRFYATCTGEEALRCKLRRIWRTI